MTRKRAISGGFGKQTAARVSNIVVNSLRLNFIPLSTAMEPLYLDSPDFWITTRKCSISGRVRKQIAARATDAVVDLEYSS